MVLYSKYPQQDLWGSVLVKAGTHRSDPGFACFKLC